MRIANLRDNCLAAALSLGLLAGSVSVCVAQPAASAPAALGSDALRAEVVPLRELNDPSQPVWVRFVLHNPTAAPIDVPLRYASREERGITLPVEFIYGPPDQPALHVAVADEKLTAVRGPALEPPTEERFLRLAAHSSVGADVDLREIHRAVRYDGTYRIEWRPLDGRIPVATAAVLVERRKDAIVVTDLGKITFSLYYDRAPLNVENFLDLIRSGFYDGKTIHRIVPNFLLQGGCSNGDGTGIRPDGATVPAEFSSLPFELGTLALARRPSDPNSASCQFLVTLDRAPELDGQYTIIGQASDVESVRTLQQLSQLPTNKNDRPMQALIIRAVRLVDAAHESPPPAATQAPAAPVTP